MYPIDIHMYIYVMCEFRMYTFLTILPGVPFQATIGIDFLSKTMYLEDRTVSFCFCILFLHYKCQHMHCTCTTRFELSFKQGSRYS